MSFRTRRVSFAQNLRKAQEPRWSATEILAPPPCPPFRVATHSHCGRLTLAGRRCIHEAKVCLRHSPIKVLLAQAAKTMQLTPPPATTMTTESPPPVDKEDSRLTQPAESVGHNQGQRRRHRRHWFLFLSCLFLTAGIWRASASGLAIWLGPQRSGGVWAVLPLGDGWVAAGTYGNRIYLNDGKKVRTIPYPRPLQVFPDQRGGAYVLGMLATRLDRIEPSGNLRNAVTFPFRFLITSVLAEPGGVWIAWQNRNIIPLRAQGKWAMPEVSAFRWCIKWFPGDLNWMDLHPTYTPLACFKDEWRDETAGIWQLLATDNRLFVVNDEAETVTCIEKQSGRLLWKMATLPRPTGAVIWEDRLLVSSAHAGAIEAYSLSDGQRIWPQPSTIGRGVSGMTLLGDKVAAVDFMHDRVLLLDPSRGTVVKTIQVDGGPRALAPLGDGLLIGLDTVARLVRLDSSWHKERVWDFAAEAK